ncbi:MAG TPA: VOC family protein [Acidobacteriaceae bacterium]
MTIAVTDWFARPVFYVQNVEASLRFYTEQMGFTSEWRYEEEGVAHVAQVEGLGCALILADTWANLRPERTGKGLIFISLNAEPEVQTATFDSLRTGLETKGVSVREGSWGYRLLVVDDPDGNQLFFNYPSESR